jgi:IclR family acetate operon transcriptional repressor
VARAVKPDPGDAAAPRYPIDSVANAARLLHLYVDRSELRISDVAELLSVSPSTAHRLLTTLEAAEMVRQNETTRCYEPGPALLSLAYAVTPSQSRWEFARPYMAELSDRVGETVNLQSLQGTDVAFIESVESTSPVRVGSRLGAVMPAHQVSGGKCLLAQMTEEDLTRLYPDPALPAGTSKSIATRDLLFTELRRVKRRGYATNFGESEPGISGVAVVVPASDNGAAAYALAVSAPSARLPQTRVRELVDELRKTAELLSQNAP